MQQLLLKKKPHVQKLVKVEPRAASAALTLVKVEPMAADGGSAESASDHHHDRLQLCGEEDHGDTELQLRAEVREENVSEGQSDARSGPGALGRRTNRPLCHFER